MNNRHLWFPIAISFLAGIVVAFIIFKRLQPKNHFAPSTQYGKIAEVLDYIQNYYFDTINDEEFIKTALTTMMQSLDPHSAYATAEENRLMTESLDGAFEGVGIQFNIMNDTVMVVAVVSGGPSEKAGIRAGDRIVSVNDSTIAGNGITNNQVFKLLRGKKHTKVRIGIHRPGFPETYFFDVQRDVIPTYTLDVAYMLDPTTGYIKINQFGENTYNEFLDAIFNLKKEGMTSLVLDLRGNSGGYLGTAINLCDEFLPKNDLIVYTEGRNKPEDKIYATSIGNFEKGNLAILIDDFSASASEIVAGAVQDNDRGWVIGRRSFGKGLVQQQFVLSDSSTIRLTVARYHTPSGRCIQRNYDKGTDDYYADLLRRYEDGEMDFADSIKFDENLKYKTKKGRTVYGGGGIMPDFFVPLDRDSNALAFNEIYNSGALIEFTFNYATEHKAAIQRKYPTAHDFVKNMVISDAIINQFTQFYQKKGNKMPTMNATSQKELRLWIKALIGRNIYEESGFYPVINSTDKTIQKALEVIHTH